MTKIYAWLIGLCIGFFLIQGQVLAAKLPPVGEPTSKGILTDLDADGVDDSVDLCPGTPAGTSVNAYGCPLSLTSCDYTTSTVNLVSSGGSTGATVSTKYVLASNTGTILQISPTASFSGLSGTATYMAVAATYDGVATNLTVGSALSAVVASCLDWSNALVFKACVAPPATCDYQAGETISLKSAGGSTGAGLKTSYVLTDVAGKLERISTVPSFPSTGLMAGTYQAYALTYTDDGTIANLVANGSTTLSQVSASCLAVSPAFPIKLCSDCVVNCVPILISRLR